MDDVFETDGSRPDLFSALRLVMNNLGSAWGVLLLAVGAATLSVAAELVPIWFTYDLIRMLVTGAATTADFIRYALILLVAIPAGYALFGLATTLSHIVAFRLIHGLRLQLAAHLLNMPLGYFTHQKSGTVRKLIIDEPERLEIIIAHAIPEGISALVTWLAVSVWLFWMDWRMAVASILLTPIAFAMMGAAMSRAMPQMTGYQNANARMNGAIGEFLGGITAIKIFRHAESARTEAEDAIRDLAVKQSAMGRRWVPLGGTFYALVLANLTVILPVGAWLYAGGTLSLPELLFFVILGSNYSQPLMRLFNVFHEFMHISMAAGVLQDTLDLEEQSDSHAELPLSGHDVRFEDVTFGYGGGGAEALRDISFTAHAGETTALVGPSGSGKSTLAHLIARFYDVQQGRVTIGGQDVSKMGRAQLMRVLAFVFQDTFLFAGTIAENLRFARPDATETEIHDAARAAQAHDFISALPDGYETVIGDGGTALSGGERQRVAIARAILKDAPVIILDEATAFADPDSEAEIQRAISALTRDKTVIVVAHRLHTVASANQILVLDEGRIAERGTHDALSRNGGLYERMWQDYMAVRAHSLRVEDEQTMEAGQ